MVVENRMVVDSEWEVLETTKDMENKLNGVGFREIRSGIFVPEENAYDYAIERIIHGSFEEKREFIEWFYSDNWVREE